MQYRIPLWLPAIVTLLLAAGIRYQNFREQEKAIIDDLITRKGYDAQLMADVLASRIAGVDFSLQQQRVVIQSVINDRHKNTLAIVQMESTSGESIELASNGKNLGGNWVSVISPIASKLVRDYGSGKFPDDGIPFTNKGTDYLLHWKSFPIAVPRDQPGAGMTLYAKVLLITNLDSATVATRQTALFWGTTLIIVVTIGITCVILINVMPFEAVRKAVKSGQPIKNHRLWPAVAVELADSINEYRDENAKALAKANKLAEEITNVNHIAVHDIKVDLLSLTKGSEVIHETSVELTGYLPDDADDVLKDAIDSIEFFSRLNIVSAKNAFDVLDQRNKLYDLESKIEITECSVSDIFQSLESAFSSESGEFRVTNNCPQGRKILADYSLLLTVLKNIVRNGFTHNDSPFKRVEVTVGPVAGKSQITITDNGVGMPPAYIESWGKTLGKAAQLRSGGSGMGLYSVRRIVLAHPNSSIKISSTVGKGTTFTLEFPHVA